MDQVGLNFHRVLDFMQKVGISTVHYLDLAGEGEDSAVVDARFPRTRIRAMELAELQAKDFWKNY